MSKEMFNTSEPLADLIHSMRTLRIERKCFRVSGTLKPYAKRIIEALDKGDAHYIKTLGKYTYIYEL